MAWLRIDDGFTGHPKIGALTDGEFRAWLRLLCWCARYRTKDIPTRIYTVLPGVTTKRLKRFYEVGLLDPNEEGYEVHDWHVYNPADAGAAGRMQKLRERSPQPRGGRWEKTRAVVYERDHGVCIDCGKTDPSWNADHDPHREDLIADGLSIYDPTYIVTRCHSCHAKRTRREATQRQESSERTQTEQEPNPLSNGSVPSRAGTCARPVPSRPCSTSNLVVVEPVDNVENEEELELPDFEHVFKSFNPVGK